MAAGLRAGVKLTAEDAIRWITINPAKSMGIDKWTGSLEAGKNADVVVWSANPFSVYAKPDQVFIDGALLYDRADRRFQPASDFVLGILPAGVAQ
jgi:imidazolonepropionase-like amidohydrolase